MKRTFLHQHGGNRTFSFVQLCLYNDTSCLAFRIGFKFHHIGSQKHHIQKIVKTFFGFGGNRYADGTPAPVFRDQAVLGQLLFYLIYIGARLVDLVDGNDDLHIRRFRMTDRLYGLGFYAVIGSDHQDRNIGRAGAAHTHGSKRFMAWRIQKCNFPVSDRYHISAYMLGNASGFFICHMGIADRVQKRSFTMVYMTHNTNYRRSGYQCLFCIFLVFQHLADYVFLFFRFRIKIIFQCNFPCGLKVQLGINRQHLSA